MCGNTVSRVLLVSVFKKQSYPPPPRDLLPAPEASAVADMGSVLLALGSRFDANCSTWNNLSSQLSGFNYQTNRFLIENQQPAQRELFHVEQFPERSFCQRRRSAAADGSPARNPVVRSHFNRLRSHQHLTRMTRMMRIVRMNQTAPTI